MADEKSNGKSKLLSDQIRNELEKLTESISGMMENMKKMETPIFESRRRLPKANEQLDKITAQTEAATHQMLDMVEQILEYQEKIVQFSGEVLEFMKKSPSEGVDTMLEKINSIHEMATTSQNSSFLMAMISMSLRLINAGRIELMIRTPIFSRASPRKKSMISSQRFLKNNITEVGDSYVACGYGTE
jgi:chemotaxis regulatin CheY-phosphate phosphatase CheZ